MAQNRPGVSGRFVVVAGQCSKVGKTTLVVDLIRASLGLRWTAVKITPYVRSGCPINGPLCPCSPSEHEFAILVEGNRFGASDSSRFLGAGASQSFWLQTKAGALPAALDTLAGHLKTAGSLIIESNSIVEFWQPDLLLLVVDPRIADFKPSARRLIPCTDVFVFRSPFNRASRAGFPIPRRIRTCKVLQRMGSTLPGKLKNRIGQPLRP